MARRNGTSRQAVQHGARIDARRGRAIGADAGEMNAAGGSERGDRRQRDRCLPSDPPTALNRCGDARPERQRADEYADHQAHVAFGPRRCELHADRVDARHADAGDRAQHERRLLTTDRSPAGPHWRPRPLSPRGEQPARIDAVRQPEQRACNAPDDKAQLNSNSSARLARRASAGTARSAPAGLRRRKTTATLQRPGTRR